MIDLLPCPFCGLPLTRGSRPINPNARCTTEDCYGGKMPVVNLDVPASVSAWNKRPHSADPAGREYDANVSPCDDAEFGMKP